ncbi:MAG: hypothetical protein P1P65_00900 [Treponema sp.]
MILFYDKDGNRLEKTYECGWSFSQKRNKEGTGKIELIDYPENAVYAELYKGTEKMQTVVITEHSRNEKRVSTSVRTLESLFKNYRIPEHWKGWDKKPLSFVLADAIYGFDYIRKTTLEDFAGYLEKHRIALSKIKDGDIHLDYHEVEDGIRYYESGYITFAFDLGDAVSERYVRWEETAGEKVYIGIQSASSDTPITHISQVDFSESPILTINRAVEHDSELTGVPIASNKRYVAVRFILKYINPDWVSDFATHKVYNEHNVLVDRTVRGFTPVLRAFEIITRKKTPFTLRSSPLNMGELVQGVELSNLTVWQAIQKIREKYPFDTRCTFEDGRLYFEFSKSFVQDRKRQYPYLLRAGDKAAEQLNNTNIKELKTNTQKVNVLHCYGEGEKLKKLYVRIPETGTFDSLPAVEEVFTDSKIKTLNELQEAGLKKLKEKRKEDNPIFEVETLQPIRLLDEVSLVHPETNRIYDAVVEEESISYKESKLTQKFGLGGFLFNPIDALIKKEVQEDIRDYAFQPFGLTAYGRHKSILLIWQGKEKEYVIKWKEKGAADYNYRKVAGFESEFTALKDDSVEYVFSVAGVFMDAVSAYTAEITAHTVTIRDGKDGKDGTTKFLASLETPGDYENQIGTFQGLLYRWSNSNWELLNAVMPVNPICAYDFADVQYKDVTQTRLRGFSYKFLAGTSYSQYSKQATDALLNGKRYRITADFEVLQGEAKFATMYYYDFTTPQPWGTDLYQSHTPVVNRRCTCVLEFVCKNTDLQGHDLRILFYNGREGAIQPNGISKWSNFKIETIADTQALDLSGNGNHANIAGNVEKRKDDKIGTILKCHNGYLARPAQNYIGVGKKWSHSRWVKIDPNKQDVQSNPRMWFYGGYDYAFFDIKANNGNISSPAIATHRDSNAYIWFNISKSSFLNNKWHHLVVMIDLQESHVKKIIYLDGEKIFDHVVKADFKDWKDTEKTYVDMSAGDATVGSLAHLMFFDRILTEQEVLWLYLNPQYPIKNYSLADWSIDPANPNSTLANATPKYLGVVETVPATRTAIITKGERLGAVDANTGDWVLSGKTIGGWKVGVCYRWTGEKWEQTGSPQYSQAALTDALELCRTMGKNENIPAVQFAEKLVALEAFVESLSAQVVYFQKSVASLVSNNPKIGDQMIFMGHNYRQYDPNEPFSFGIDELAYKGSHSGQNIEVWRELMRTKQIRNIAGASILSLFLTGCIQASGGYEMPIGSAISENKLKNIKCYSRNIPAITADGEKAISDGVGDFVYSDDGLKTFKKIEPNISIQGAVSAYKDKFYAVMAKTSDYYSSTDGVNWKKQGEIKPYKPGDFWEPLFDKSAQTLGFVNHKTGERIYIYNKPQNPVSTPPDKPHRLYATGNNKVIVAYSAMNYEGLSVSYDKGNTWEHYDNLFPEYSYKAGFVIIRCYNNIFYLFFKPIDGHYDVSNGCFISKNGKDWSRFRPEIKNMRNILYADGVLLLIYADAQGKNTFIENLYQKEITQKIENFYLTDADFYPQLNSVVLTGKSDYAGNQGALYVIPTKILTGSGITNFETTDNYLAAQFGNGLQLIAYSGGDCPKPFIGKAYTFNGIDNDKMKIGRWF